jgi:hypothetical protein
VTTTEIERRGSVPPAYIGVPVQPGESAYFAYRERGDRFGYDWVRIFEFRAPFVHRWPRHQTWDGVVLVDATTLTPVEIRAEPGHQQERLKLLFERWSQSFN